MTGTLHISHNFAKHYLLEVSTDPAEGGEERLLLKTCSEFSVPESFNVSEIEKQKVLQIYTRYSLIK